MHRQETSRQLRLNLNTAYALPRRSQQKPGVAMGDLESARQQENPRPPSWRGRGWLHGLWLLLGRAESGLLSHWPAKAVGLWMINAMTRAATINHKDVISVSPVGPGSRLLSNAFFTMQPACQRCAATPCALTQIQYSQQHASLLNKKRRRFRGSEAAADCHRTGTFVIKTISSRADWHRRFLAVVAGPDPAVLGVRRLRVVAELVAELRQFVGLDGVAAGLDVDIEEAGGV